MKQVNLENSHEIKGNEAIILNKLVPEYNKANAQLKDLKQTVEALKEQIVSLSVAGVNKTNKVAWKIVDVAGSERVVGTKVIKEKDMKLYEKLVAKELTYFTEGSTRISNITIL